MKCHLKLHIGIDIDTDIHCSASRGPSAVAELLVSKLEAPVNMQGKSNLHHLCCEIFVLCF